MTATLKMIFRFFYQKLTITHYDLTMDKTGSLIGGISLVAGTCIGGGVLALPILTSAGGFAPSIALYLICWAFMFSTGIIFLEVTHWMKGESNFTSMAEKTLGPVGKAFAWVIYLFFFYCLMIAYVVGCGKLITQVFPIPEWIGSLSIVILFVPFIFAGAKIVGKLNVFLMTGLILSYAAFIFLGYEFVNNEFLLEKNWPLSLFALPVIFASFGYQGIIPTLCTYFNYDIKRTFIAILIGSLIPLIAYIIWQWLILGIIPAYGDHGLVEALHKGENVVEPLKYFTQNPNIYILGQFFAFFALTTSFFGVGLALLDFLADGFRIEKNAKGKLFLSFLIFVPPLLVAKINPNVFIDFLNLAGGFGSAFLLGLLPILMVWSGRYRLKLNSKIKLPGGKITLLFLMTFVFFELFFEAFNLLYYSRP